jgi:hypothetical protein
MEHLKIGVKAFQEAAFSRAYHRFILSYGAAEAAPLQSRVARVFRLRAFHTQRKSHNFPF